jgi:hypothetical protein
MARALKPMCLWLLIVLPITLWIIVTADDALKVAEKTAMMSIIFRFIINIFFMKPNAIVTEITIMRYVPI